MSSPEQASIVGSFADVVILGSAFIRALNAHTGSAGVTQAGLLAHRLAGALDRWLFSAA